MLTLSQGNFQQIKDFKDRIQKVIKAALPGGGASAAVRQEKIQQAVLKIKELVVTAKQDKEAMIEEFDPAIQTNEVFEQRAPAYFNSIIDYTGDDAGFIKLIKDGSKDIFV